MTDGRPNVSRIWDALIPEEERRVFETAGYGKRAGWGASPALVVVDVNYNFVGDRPEPILESIKRFRNSCGEVGWRAIPRIARLLWAARAAEIAIFYTTQGYSLDRLGLGGWGAKNARALDVSPESREIGAEIVREIAPRPGEVVIKKTKPSAFFGTPLASFLTALQVDTLVVAGTTTSGCVRASVVDAFSLNYRVVVVEDCCFDRGETSHRVNLFDLNAKYADVLPLDEVVAHLATLAGQRRVTSGAALGE